MNLVGLDVVVFEGVEFIVDERRFVAQQLDLALVGFEVVQRVLDLLQLGVHVALCVVDDTAETCKGAREFPEKIKSFDFLSQIKFSFDSLLNLMTAVGRRKVDDQLQLSCRMSHVLIFEFAFLGLVCPRQSLVSVDRKINTADSEQNTPSDGLEKLVWGKKLS